MGYTYQEDNGNVEHESAKTVEEEGKQADVVNLVDRASGNLPDQGNNTVHDSADGREVVQRDQGVHLVVSGAQQSLDHGKSEGLKDDTTDLVHDTDHHKVDFSARGDDDTDDDDRDVEELPQARRGNAESPAGDENGNRSGGLEHLDESDREVQVGQVSADQT